MPDYRKDDYFKLRAEWLKYKSNLFDKNTNLPTLPIIIDDARKMMDKQGVVGLLLIDLAREKNFEATYGWQVYDEIIRKFASILQETRKEILNEKDLIAVSNVRSDEFILFLNPPVGKAWTEPVLEIVNEKVRNAIRKKMERFSGQRWYSNLTFHTAYASILRDPTMRIERVIHGAVAKAREMSHQEIENEIIQQHVALQRIISQNSIITYFQPIVYLDDLEILGYEALSRGPEDSGFEGTEILFTFAESTNMLCELERICRRNALRAAQSLHLDRKLFLNSSARAFQDTDFTPTHLSELVSELGLKQENIVFEITERVSIEEWKSFKKVLDEARSHGFKVAIDDMGAGYSSLQAIAELQPDFLKFDISLVHNINENLIKMRLLETIVSLSSKIHAQVIAEGIEDREEYQTVRNLGVQLGQGFYFASPAIDFPQVTH